MGGRVLALAHRGGCSTGMVWIVLIVAVCLNAAGARASYAESCVAGSPPCTSRVAAIASGHQTVSDLAQLYGASVADILGANNLDLTEKNVTTKLIPLGNLVLIPLMCACVNASRRTNETVYTVKQDDTLDNISRTDFGALVTYQEIAAANNIQNANQIDVGQKLIIPFQCACENNTFKGAPTVFVTYVVQNLDDLSSIAMKFGTTATDIATLNNIQNVTAIGLNDVLEIPLAACPSTFRTDALDYGLLVTSGSYSLSPGQGCVQSSCYGNPMLELRSVPAPILLSSSTAKCPNLDCSNRATVGNVTTAPAGTGSCEVTSCVYSGTANTSAIFATLTTNNESTCPVASPAPPEREVESTSYGPFATSLPPSPAPSYQSGPSSADTTLSSQVLWRSMVGVACSIFLPLYLFGRL